jgi:hypothetical protein
MPLKNGEKRPSKDARINELIRENRMLRQRIEELEAKGPAQKEMNL